MPPKPKYTREEIVDAAFRLMDRSGMDAVVAREVGKELGSTVAPIFTCFQNMDDLKAAVHEKAIHVCSESFRDFTDYFPAFKEFGLRWVKLAREHPHVYREVFLRKTGIPGEGLFNADLWQMLAPMRREIVSTFSLSASDADSVMRDMLIYVHGIAAMLISGQAEISDEELRVGLSRMCLSYVAGCRIRDGLPEHKMLHHMFAHLDLIPRKRNEFQGGIPYDGE